MQEENLKQENLDNFEKQDSANMNRASEERIEPKINVSRDGKWIIIRVPGIEQPIIKPAAYFEKILEKARSRMSYA